MKGEDEPEKFLLAPKKTSRGYIGYIQDKSESVREGSVKFKQNLKVCFQTGDMGKRTETSDSKYG